MLPAYAGRKRDGTGTRVPLSAVQPVSRARPETMGDMETGVDGMGAKEKDRSAMTWNGPEKGTAKPVNQ